MHVLFNVTSSAAYYVGGFTSEKTIVVAPDTEAIPPWRDRSIAGPMLRLVELSAFVERHPDDLV